MGIILSIMVLLLVVIGSFYATCHIVKIWTGCDTNEAIQKVHNFMNGTANIDFTTDEGFIEEVWTNVHNIIGDNKFNQLIKLSNSSIGTPLLSTGYNSELPYIAISVYYADEGEKQRLESVLTNVVSKYLHMSGYDTRLSVNWKRRYDLDMPLLEVRYAKTTEQKLILNEVQRKCCDAIIKRNTDIFDETEEEDLND